MGGTLDKCEKTGTMHKIKLMHIWKSLSCNLSQKIASNLSQWYGGLDVFTLELIEIM